jgi:branched-chain amino acid transport system permease protein
MSQTVFLQSAVNALALGATYGLLGLSFGLIYSTTQILHFAHGATYICAAYFLYAAYALADWPLQPAVLIVLAGAGAVGFAMMRWFYEPMVRRNTSGAVIMIASLGLFIAIENLTVLIFGNDSRVISKASVQEGIALRGVYITPLQIISVATAVSVFVLIYLVVTRSKLGRALRAIADDSGVAVTVGIDVHQLRYLVFVIGSMTLGVAAVLNSLDVGVSPGMGLSVVLIAAVAAIIGGASGIFGGVAGGFLIGAIQSMGVMWIDPRWQNLMIFSVLIIVLVVKPTGLFGSVR